MWEFKAIKDLERSSLRHDHEIDEIAGKLNREISELKADIRELRSTMNALLIAKNAGQASGAGLAGMLREAADEAAEIEDEAAEAVREEAEAFAEFLKKYEKEDLDG